VQDVGRFEYAFLHGSEHFLDDLPHLRLHLEPLELLDLELGVVLGHRIKLIDKIRRRVGYRVIMHHWLILLRSSLIVLISMRMYCALLTESSIILSCEAVLLFLHYPQLGS
jgi:hypothetical protein